MGKISPASAKYIIHSKITIEGTVDRSDVIGAIFGQTEGLLGSELELRELQRNGKIGRIEVNIETKAGKASGSIIVPSSLDKAETAIIGASLETIQRIGPCDAKVASEKIEDVRISKRNQVIERAKELLRELTENILPDSQEIAEEVAHSVRMMEITEYGKDRLPAGPAIEESNEIILVEGRADVLNLLKNNIKNGIALNGTSVPETIKEICKKKEVTVFVDGDRGGDLIIKELLATTEIDFIAKAPDGKEVEEITKKELHKALRSKIATEQAKLEIDRNNKQPYKKKEFYQKREFVPKKTFPKKDFPVFKEILEELIGTKATCLVDESSNILGKVPTTELETTLRNLRSGVHAVIIDGKITRDANRIAERANVKFIIGTSSEINKNQTRLNLLTKEEL